MNVVLYDWPYAGLAAAVMGIVLLLVLPWSETRWRDPSWLICLALPIYMLHQFEEHGINLLGERYHFLPEMCAILGYPDPTHCPATPAFIAAVNCGGGVWIPGLLGILFLRRNILVGACGLGIPLVNAVVHIGVGIARARYNSGLLTAATLFVPFCVWTLLQLHRKGLLRPPALIGIIASGVLLHATLAVSILGHAHDFWGETPVLLMNVLDGFIPLGVASLLMVRSPFPPPASFSA